MRVVSSLAGSQAVSPHDPGGRWTASGPGHAVPKHPRHLPESTLTKAGEREGRNAASEAAPPPHLTTRRQREKMAEYLK